MLLEKERLACVCVCVCVCVSECVLFYVFVSDTYINMF